MKLIETSSFLVEDLGIQEIDVYDIEVEENHNFFANNILVHNSNYIDFSEIVQKYFSGKSNDEIVEALDKFSQVKVEPFIDSQMVELNGILNAISHRLVMKRESIGPAVFVNKKRYAMDVYDSEGIRYAKPKMKVMGLESVRSTTPAYFRSRLNDAFKIIVSHQGEDAIQAEIAKQRAAFPDVEFSQFASPTAVNNVEGRGLHEKGLPAHVRAALVYNKMVEEKGLSGKYEMITEGEKIKWLYLSMPNPAQSHVIAYKEVLPPEFNLVGYVDREAAFNDKYLTPLTRMLEVCGYSSVPRVNLFDFMGEDEDEGRFRLPEVKTKQKKLSTESTSIDLSSMFGE